MVYLSAQDKFLESKICNISQQDSWVFFLLTQSDSNYKYYVTESQVSSLWLADDWTHNIRNKMGTRSDFEIRFATEAVNSDCF